MQDVIILSRDTLTATRGTVLREILDPGGVFVRQIRCRFYPGSACKLNIRPYILRHGDTSEDFVLYSTTPGAKITLDGEAEWVEIPTGRRVEQNESLAVDYENVGLFPQAFAVHFIVEKAGGSA